VGLVLEWATLVVAVIVLTLANRTFLAQAFYIPTASMVPQLKVNDRILVSKLSYRLHEPRRGDIVVFDEPAALRQPRPPNRSNVLVRAGRSVLQGINVVKPQEVEFVKRVVGLPGDTIEGRQGNVYVNGQLLVEPYLPAGATTAPFAKVKVQEGQLFMMGDNRPDSYDSRFFGPIPRSSVVGRVVVRIWPPSAAAWL